MFVTTKLCNVQHSEEKNKTAFMFWILFKLPSHAVRVQHETSVKNQHSVERRAGKGCFLRATNEAISQKI